MDEDSSLKVYVTGVAGFLGSHIADALFEEGHYVVGCDNFSGGELDNVPKTCEFHEQDCCDLTGSDFDDVDTVYHCAALAHEGFSVFSPRTITKSIFEASVAVFSAAISAGVRRIVYTSSMSRYGSQASPFLEIMAPAPQDPYAIAKVAAEQVLKVLCDVHGVEYVVAVPHNIVGPRQKFDDPFRNVAAIMANLMLQGRQPYVYGDGSQVRCFSDVRDVVPCFTRMMVSPEVIGKTINVGPDEEFISIAELAARLALIIDPTLKPLYGGERPQEVKEAVCRSDLARRLLDYRTRYSLDETLESLVNWIAEVGPCSFDYHLPIEIYSDLLPATWKEELF